MLPLKMVRAVRVAYCLREESPVNARPGLYIAKFSVFQIIWRTHRRAQSLTGSRQSVTREAWLPQKNRGGEGRLPWGLHETDRTALRSETGFPASGLMVNTPSGVAGYVSRQPDGREQRP